MNYKAKQSSNTTELRDFSQITNVLFEIKKMGFYVKEVDSALSVELISLRKEEKIVIPNDDFHRWRSSIDVIKNHINSFIFSMNYYLTSVNDTEIAIKIPYSKSIKDISKNLGELEKALNQILINKVFKGKVEVVDFERGSLWIIVLVGIPKAVEFILKLAKLYYDVAEKRLELKKKEKEIELDIQELDLKKKIRKSLSETLKNFEEKGIGNLFKELNISDRENEEKLRIGHGVKALFKLIDEGIEIQPANITENAAHLPSPHKLLKEIKKLESGLNKPKEGSSSFKKSKSGEVKKDMDETQ